jgi:hypothetical protein
LSSKNCARLLLHFLLSGVVEFLASDLGIRANVDPPPSFRSHPMSMLRQSLQRGVHTAWGGCIHVCRLGKDRGISITGRGEGVAVTCIGPRGGGGTTHLKLTVYPSFKNDDSSWKLTSRSIIDLGLLVVGGAPWEV